MISNHDGTTTHFRFCLRSLFCGQSDFDYLNRLKKRGKGKGLEYLAIISLFELRSPSGELHQLFICAVVVPLSAIEFRDLRHLGIGEFEIEDVEVIPDVIYIPASGDDGESHLNVPPEDDLCGALAVLLSQFCEDGLRHQSAVPVSERIPAHDLDVVLIKERTEILLREIRVCFHLDELGDDLPLVLQRFDVLTFEVGDPDRLCFSIPVGLLQLPVSCKPVALAEGMVAPPAAVFFFLPDSDTDTVFFSAIFIHSFIS